MSRRYTFHDNNTLYFISSAVVDWINFFIREEYKRELIKALIKKAAGKPERMVGMDV